ncbi:SPDY domain-containing protein [Streptomyces malaysiensis]|uniref:DUF317 domain-containing protein n=1 Tax=Streptomyces malaysiensis TaxID=92644 RepID=UPI00321F8742|nr:DUF317 domain-containing protein [Streptomyces malaysiensis]
MTTHRPHNQLPTYEQPCTTLPKVSPRYLAGPRSGDASEALAPLDVAGWPKYCDERFTVHRFAPDGRRCVIYHAEERPCISPRQRAMWRAWARRANGSPMAWMAHWTTSTPPEIIAAFTTAR